MGRSDDEELIRARLAYLGAGRRGLGDPRRGVVDDDAPASQPPASAPVPPLLPRFRVQLRHVAVVALLVLIGIGVSFATLGRSSATVVPVEPVVVSTAAPAAAVSTTDGPSSSAPLRVHVAGEVRSPGVVLVSPGAIVQDAIESAGGLTKEADPALLNLAAQLADGMQIVVGSSQSPAGEIVGEATATQGLLVNLNTATAEQLEELPGVGPVTAAAIVAWRAESGPFSAVDDLQEVSGIGPKTYEQLRELVTI
ncbi:ComEA family DNA-binding protein [Tessaracoccus palaemonis]|uniref:ComEA family DNA-binding protein n=1 Tax=Tessaracoccus palaemonis TaxID=2829499 RepID=A0ABX8SEQ4_9ACTN|nr:ComEA family DNA-binding protein [Tessaracoccus palaemonis]QXT61851.1 ComEA family DNA-binding protein [Tessaracoccus palaemonis]